MDSHRAYRTSPIAEVKFRQNMLRVKGCREKEGIAAWDKARWDASLVWTVAEREDVCQKLENPSWQLRIDKRENR